MATTSQNPEAPASLAAWPDSASLDRPARYGRPPVRLVTDASVLLVGTLVAELSLSGDGGFGAWLLSFPVLVFVLLHVRRAHPPTVRPQILDELRVVATATALAAMTVLSLRVLLGAETGAGSQTAREWLFAAVGLGTARMILGFRDFRLAQRGDAGIPTLIVGAGKVGHLVARRLAQYPEFGLRPIGFLDDAPLEDESSVVPVLGGMEALDRVVHQYGARRVIVTFSAASHEVLLDVIRRSEDLGLKASFVPRLFETMKERVRIDCVGSLPLVSVAPTNPRGWVFSFKYALDRILAALLLIVSAPLLAASALAVWVSLGRPILFRQPRVGQDGRVFRMLKFRSMNGGSEWSPSELPPDTAPGGVEGDDRRTGVGSFLRRTSLDELPQLINVLRGEMSLVGPRPERPDFAARFEQSVHRYGERHRVKAGITGWAQINGLRGKTSLADRAEWDNYYIDNWSPWLDFKILMLTGFALLRFPAE